MLYVSGLAFFLTLGATTGFLPRLHVRPSATSAVQ
jgi:hypothetical protein